jgi:hypothetical protein
MGAALFPMRSTLRIFWTIFAVVLGSASADNASSGEPPLNFLWLIAE